MFSVKKNAIDANKYETIQKYECNDALYTLHKPRKKNINDYNNPIYVPHIWHSDFLSIAKYSFIY